MFFFEPYPFTVRQEMNTTQGPRNGDLEVIDVTEKKVKLCCPVSLREFEWDRFCYFIDKKNDVESSKTGNHS